ncbi:MAG: hypothetical protein U9Q80_07610 [Bacillota bacterium]|nr:hypothetical protein [Bacillota bacterium]
MRKRRVVGVIMVLTILIISAGCMQDTYDPVMETALDMAYADFSLRKLGISVSEYIEITERHLINPERYYEEPVFGLDGVMYDVNDIRRLNEEELTNLKEYLYKSAEEAELADLQLMKSVLVSEVIDDINFSFKHVIVRGENVLLGKESYVFRKYTFKQDDDKWRILTVMEYVDFIEEPRMPDMMQRYLEYDGKTIEYPMEIKLAE